MITMASNITLAPQVPDRWGEAILARFPPELSVAARERWMHIANTGVRYPGIRHPGDGYAPHAKANRTLWQLRDELDSIKFSVAVSAADIATAAAKLADLCERGYSGERIAAHFGIEPTWPKVATDESIYRRFCDPKWWRKQLHVVVGRAIEEVHRKRGLVRLGKAVYLTDWSLGRWRGKRAANRRMLEDSVVVDDEGTQLGLWEVSQNSVANPELRRKEMMLRARGFELQAKQHGYTWTFVTLTAPSAFHPQLKRGGDNPRYQGVTVRQAQSWLCGAWERSRATLHREGLMIFGFRVAEPHHDGTPHWHALLFVRPEQVDRLEEVLRDTWLSDYADEPGAVAHRVSFEREDTARPGSSAAGYIAKYIGKNIDGHGVDVDREARTSGADGAERATAWASVHGIRQFQQLGGPAVGLWRELRRLRDPVAPPEIEAARVHTSKPACWSGFIDAVGGIAAGRKTSLQIWKQETLDLGRYGEPRAPRTVGVNSLMHWIRTRCKVWRIERRNGCVSSRSVVTSGGVVACWSGSSSSSDGEQGSKYGPPSAGLSVDAKSGCATEIVRSGPTLGPVSITVRDGYTAGGGLSFEGSAEHSAELLRKPARTGLPPQFLIEEPPWMH